MGKPYEMELGQLVETYRWALTVEGGPLREALRSVATLPLLTVGSGGSFTAADFAATAHRELTGLLATALTPLEACAQGGAVVVFEPSGVGAPNLFCEAWRLAHVVKYSHERLRDLADLELTRADREAVLLEVETLGSEGLRYRSRLPGSRTRGWQTSDAVNAPEVKDAAGSGDWCTAGLLDKLARAGLVGLKKVSAEKLREAVRHGQALAAWNCGFEGARGGMYKMNPSEFPDQVKRIASGAHAPPQASIRAASAARLSLGGLCPACNDADAATPPELRHGSRR